MKNATMEKIDTFEGFVSCSKFPGLIYLSMEMLEFEISEKMRKYR